MGLIDGIYPSVDFTVMMMAVKKIDSSTDSVSAVPTMPAIADRPHAIPSTKELGFVSAIVFDGEKDHDCKQFDSHVWLAIPVDPKSRKVGSVYLGQIIEGRYQPSDDWQSVDSDLAAMLFPTSGQHGPEQQKLAQAIDRIVKRVARADFDDSREQSRIASQASREATGKARLELVKSMIG